MDLWHYTILELLSEQRLRERRTESERLHLVTIAGEAGRGRFSLRRALASTLVRWGLHLDPTAGERQGALDLAHEGKH